MGNRTERFDDLFPAHADSVVAHRKRGGVFVCSYPYLPVAVMLKDILVREGLITCLVNGIRGIGYQFPEEYLLVRIEGMHH